MGNHNFHTTKEELEKPVTLGLLLEYTDEFLIPKVSEIVESKVSEIVESKVSEIVESKVSEIVDKKINTALGVFGHNLKAYIDDKLADHTSDIFKRLDRKYQNGKKDKKFKVKVVALFKKHHIGTREDVAFLDGLVAGD
jgi:hypothetical protein